jgi:hypothetical protein
MSVYFVSAAYVTQVEYQEETRFLGCDVLLHGRNVHKVSVKNATPISGENILDLKDGSSMFFRNMSNPPPEYMT